MIKTIRNENIKKAFQNTTRQYLVGNLMKPQILDFFKDENLEIGLTEYTKYSTEKPHFHTIATEYQLILEGKTKYFDLTENKECRVSYDLGHFFMKNVL